MTKEAGNALRHYCIDHDLTLNELVFRALKAFMGVDIISKKLKK